MVSIPTKYQKLSKIKILVNVSDLSSSPIILSTEMTGNTKWVTNITGFLSNNKKNLEIKYNTLVNGNYIKPLLNYVSVCQGFSFNGSPGHFALNTTKHIPGYGQAKLVSAFVKYYSPTGIQSELSIPENFIITLKSYSIHDQNGPL